MVPLVALLIVLINASLSSGFSLVMMGAKRGRGGLKRSLSNGPSGKNKNKGGKVAPNLGRGQEITGVSLPAEGKMKGWEFGNKVQIACFNVGGEFYGLQGDCPRCAFELYKGDLILERTPQLTEPSKTKVPCVACPTCSTTFSLETGQHGPPLKRGGLSGFVNNLAKTATAMDAYKNAKAFVITRDETDGRVYMRER